MLLLRLLDILGLLLAALVLGVFWGPWLGLTRSISSLTPEVFLILVHRLDRNLGAIMSVLFPVTLFVLAAITTLSIGSTLSFCLALGAFLLYLIALIVTAAVEVPIVKQIRGWSDSSIPANWRALRDRWVSFHLLRVLPGIAGFALLTASALWQR